MNQKLSKKQRLLLLLFVLSLLISSVFVPRLQKPAPVFGCGNSPEFIRCDSASHALFAVLVSNNRHALNPARATLSVPRFADRFLLFVFGITSALLLLFGVLSLCSRVFVNPRANAYRTSLICYIHHQSDQP